MVGMETMKKRPHLSIGIITWPNKPERLEYLERSIRRLRTYLLQQERIGRWICTTETKGMNSRMEKELEVICAAYQVNLVYHDGSPSIGGNINNLLNYVGDDSYLFLAEDDRLLTQDLDLFGGVSVLEKYPEFSLINYSHTALKYRCLRGDDEIENFHVVSLESPWAIVNFQLLFRPGFFSEYGKYYEDPEHPDAAERDMNIRVKSQGVLTLYTPTYYFVHCGEVSAINRE